MDGYQLTFFTQQNHCHRGKPLAHWLVAEARAIGINGATLVAASEGFGHHRRIHSVHFIELADQPLEVVMAVTAQESDRLFARLKAEKVKVFYSKTPVEFGTVGEEEVVVPTNSTRVNPTNGYQLTFFTQQDHRHHGKSVAHWLVEKVRAMGVGGATLLAGSEGFGHHRRLHLPHLFKFTDQPLEVVMAVTADEADRIFAVLKAENVKIVYSKTPIEFGTLGEEE